MICHRGDDVRCFENPNIRGSAKYSFAPTGPVVFAHFGGVYQQQCLILGEVAIAMDSPMEFKQKLFNCYARQIRKKFTNVYRFWLGEETLELYKRGLPLRQDIRAGYHSLIPPYEDWQHTLEPMKDSG